MQFKTDWGMLGVYINLGFGGYFNIKGNVQLQIVCILLAIVCMLLSIRNKL